jgi:uncharacterized membrane protein
MSKSRYLAQAGMIAAAYATFTIICILFLGSLAWGLIQFRISEALTILAVFTSAAVPGLSIGCFFANLIAIPLTGSGLTGLFDVFFGSLATLLGALWCRKFRDHTGIALLGPVIANALIVPAYLPIILQGLGLYTIPFTTIDLEAFGYLFVYLFGVLCTGIGEAVVVYALGLPLLKLLRHNSFFRRYFVLDDSDGGDVKG